MVNVYELLIKRYSMAGDGEPAEEWTVDRIKDSTLEMLIVRWQNYQYTHNLRKPAGLIDFVSVTELSTVRLVLFKVYI